MTHTDMTKPFSTNPKLADWVAQQRQQRQNLADWVPSEQQIQTITAARQLLDLDPEEEGSEIHKSVINALHCMCRLNPRVTDPQELVDDTYEFLMQSASYLSRAKRKGGN